MDDVTGTGGNWSGDGLDSEIDCALWVPGVDYITGWREARAVTERLNAALRSAGFELSELRAVAASGADGCGVVRLAGRPGAMDRLAGLLKSASDGGRVL
ncbi:hypothetical protein ACIBCM_17155 [Streptomyces sp. NPDC051018]|uniref:hypothetical protein n=1 Tax=Streptomyces sp. NPDC051018 TaxID=3365639 RepID=UPI0037B1DA0F